MPPPSKSLGPSRPPRRYRTVERHASAEERLHFLLEASERLSLTSSAETTLRTLAELLVPRLADGCIVSLADASRTLRPVNIAHSDAAMSERMSKLSEDSSLLLEMDRALETNASVHFQDASDLGVRSAMLVPLRHGKRAIGVVALFANERQPFERIDLKLVEKLASRATLAIERAQLREYERRATERLRLLQRLTSGLSRAVTLQDVGRLIVEEVPATLGADVTAVYLSTARGESLQLLSEKGLPEPTHASEALLLSQPHPLTDAVRSGEPVRIESQRAFIERYPGARKVVSGEASAVCVPLIVDDRRVGALGLGFPKGRVLDDAELGFVLTVASQCAQAIERARLYSEAELTMRLRDDFLSLASHELNTPLTSLKLALGHLGRSQHEPRTFARLLGVIERQADRLGHLVTDLLDVSRLTGGNVTLELDDTDLVAVVNDTISRFATDLQRSGSQLSITAPASLVGHWDRHRLEQIASCLVSNAIKFGRGDPIEIVIEQAGQHARLSVRDSGIGIPKERLARIFDRYERAVATPHFGGFGLGLWLSHRVVEAMGGTIRVESQLGRGTSFFVELPLRYASR